MPERLNTPARLEAARAKIAELFAAHAEWFCTLGGAGSQALRRSELEVAADHGRLILTMWTEQGSRSWKVFAWEWSGEKLTLRASRRMGAERPLIELVPRAAAAAFALTVKAARQARAAQLGQLACLLHSNTRLERAVLSPGARRGQPGRYARILLRQKQQRIAVTGCVAASRPGEVDAFLSSALLWFKRTAERARAPYVQQLWLVVESDLVKPVTQRVALLRQSLREALAVFEVDQHLTELKLIDVPAREDLWRRRLSRFPPVRPVDLSKTAQRLLTIAPGAIDVVSARHGETLRDFGCPFARVRRFLGDERLWFGV